jgi:ABC-type polysaccharide/polyol phosphate transport system ATPase subunit
VTGAILDVSQAEREQRIAAAPTAVAIDHLAKTFRLPHQRYSTLKERALHPFRSTTFDELRALRDVDVRIHEGEFFGIVGRNGSGKSTLLKCLAGIYRPDAGRVTLHGRLSPFIELGVGFNPDLTARDNIIINAVMMGLSRREARERFEQIIQFAELEEFVDLKLKNYSSGMAVRLGFATAIQVDADVLLVDEVLAVGDAAFQQKCFEEFARLREEGKTIVFVTHDMHAVERFCDRAMLIERGAVLEIGAPREIARAYNELNFGRLVHEDGDDHARLGDQGLAEIVEAWFEHDGERVKQIAQGQRLTIAVTVRFHGEVAHPIVGVTLRNEMGHTFFVSTTEWQAVDLGTRQAGDRLTLRFTLDTPFAQSRYLLTPSVARAGSGSDAIDVREDLTSVHIHATQHTGGLVDMPHSIEVEEA